MSDKEEQVQMDHNGALGGEPKKPKTESAAKKNLVDGEIGSTMAALQSLDLKEEEEKMTKIIQRKPSMLLFAPDESNGDWVEPTRSYMEQQVSIIKQVKF